MTASVWAPGTSIDANSGIRFEDFIATDLQTLFTLTDFTYVVGTNSLTVYVNGLIQILGTDFVETSTGSFTFSSGLPVGAKVYAIGMVNITGTTNYDPNAARKGNNNDITSLAGLTTALSIVQGGTGGITAAAARAALAAAAAGANNDITSLAAVTSQSFGDIRNLSLVASVAANALTIALKTKAGTDATATDKISIPFRSATAANGDFATVDVTSASSLVISNGSTLGSVADIANRSWIVGFNDAGTFRLGLVNCLTTVAGAGSGRDVTAIYPLRDDVLASSTAEGGAGAADSAQVIYTGTAVSAKAMRVLGYLEYNVGLATAGVYATVPTKLQLFGQGISLPGQVVQTVSNDTGAVATGTTIVPFDDTIPQSGEGDQYMSQTITPVAAPNALFITVISNAASSSASAVIGTALFKDAVANALAAFTQAQAGAGAQGGVSFTHRMLADGVAATTFKVRIGPHTASTVTFNGTGGVRLYGGVMSSSLNIEEIMG